MKIKRKNEQSSRKGSVLGLIFLALFVLSLAIAGLWGSFVLSLTNQSYVEQMENTSLAEMEEIENWIQQTVQRTMTQMEETLWSTDCSRLMVSGTELSYSLQSNVMRDMSTLVNQESVIRDAWIYFSAANRVLGADGDSVEAEESVIQEVLESGEQAVTSQGNFYLVLSYPESKSLATMVVELEAEALYEGIRDRAESLWTEGAVYLFDAEGEPLFEDYIEYPAEEEWMVGDTAEERGSGRIYRSGSDYVLVMQSETFGWYLVQKIQEMELRISISQAILPLMFCGVLSVVLLLLTLLFLEHWVNAPFRQALDTLEDSVNPDRARKLRNRSQNEVEFLKNFAEESQAYNESVQRMLRQAEESLNEGIFLWLLQEGQWEEEDVHEQLRQANSSFRSDALYAVFEWSCRAEGSEEPLSREVYYFQLKQICEGYWRERGLAQMVTLPGGENCLIVSPAQTGGEAVWKRECDLFEKFVGRQMPTGTYSLKMGSSSLGDLTGLWQLRQQARDDLLRQNYHLESGKSDETKRFREEWEILIQSLRQKTGDNRELASKIEDLVSRIGQEPQPLQICRELMDQTVERLVLLHLEMTETMNAIRQQMHGAEETDGVTLDQVRVFLEEGAVLIQNVQSKDKKSSHIDRAKKIIEEKYFDNTLSLESVSEELGLSVPYLSKLFRQYQPPGFLDYLNRYRLKQAKKLLQETDNTVENVGFKAGFSSAQNFIRVFKRYEGETPGQFRNHRQEDR